MNFRFFILFYAVLILLSSCTSKTQVEAPKSAVVFTKKVQLEQLADLLNYPARVKSKVNATILSESEGIITRVLVDLGKKVYAKQTLMVLNHTDPVYQYAPLQILAPIQGIVSSIDVTPGSHVVQGQKLAAVINPSQLEIEVEIPAQDLALIQKGMEGEFKISTRESPHPVRVSGVSPFVDPNTGTALGELEILSKPHTVLSPGLQGQVTFKAHSRQGFIVPDSSIIYKGKDLFIRVVENQKIKQIPIIIGTKQRGSVEILKGLYEGALLVERASRFVAEGESVEIENPQESEKTENHR